jgi:hypothetical protein
LVTENSILYLLIAASLNDLYRLCRTVLRNRRNLHIT